MATTTRAEIATWIGLRYGRYLDAVGRLPEDSPEGLGPALDDSERALGGPAYPLAFEDQEDMLLQASYRTMEQVVRDMGPEFFNVSVSGNSFSLQQVRAAAEKDLASLKEEMTLAFGSISGGGGGIITMDLNYLTERPTREVFG